jgi:TonB family protein
MLPAIIQQQYLQAKGAWDRQEFGTAAAGFGAVLEGLDDPDLAVAANQSPLSDLRILAVGFRDLSVRATSPPPPQTQATANTAGPAAASPAAGIFGVDDTNVATPIMLHQSIPAVPRKVVVPTQIAVEVIVDETGSVESAAMKISTNSPYDQIILAAAQKWRYQPATLQGVPVKYRKIVTIDFSPSR